jgi:hypothetical protein
MTMIVQEKALRPLIIMTPLLILAVAQGADPPQDDKALAEEFRLFASKEASAYTIRLPGSDQPLTLQPEPVLKWSNPVIGTVFGDVFIWTDHGRPEAVASIYRFYSAPFHRANEFHSLALRPLVCKRDGATVWTPIKPGLDLKPIPGAAAPADSAAARLRQLRALAQEFTGRQTNREGVDRDMRLLSQPVYRYENALGGLIDGGLFAFVLGTDPEVFLLIEARQSAAGPLEWQFGATRMNSINLRLYHRGQEIWSVPEITWARAFDSTRAYVLFGFDVETKRK